MVEGKNFFFDKVNACRFFFGLLFLNFLTHFLFIFRLSFVSDDWSELVYSVFKQYSFHTLLLESQRPLYYIILKGTAGILERNAFAYQVLNLTTTTLILFLIFLISDIMLKKVFKDSRTCAFLVAGLFCISFNTDQLYNWSIIFANNFAFILYLSSMYFYINPNRKPSTIFLSLFTYFVAVFTYELGIFLPLIYFVYDYVFDDDWKRSILFIIPSGLYGIIRATQGFGMGWAFINRDYWSSSEFFPRISQNFLHNFVQEGAVAGLNFYYGITGLFSLNQIMSIALVLSDIACIFLLMRYCILPWLSQEGEAADFRSAMKLFLLGAGVFFICHTIISISGDAAPRHMIFIDFFILLGIVALAGTVLTKKSAAVPVFCIILLCVLINQGLSVNWIIAGDICNSVDRSISEDAGIISGYHYVFVNGTDLRDAIPNAALKYNFRNYQYNNYLNSPCLPDWSVLAMLSGAGVNTSAVRLIYGNYPGAGPAGAPVQSEKTSTLDGMDRKGVFEFNSTNLLQYYYREKSSDLLFSQ